MSTLSDVNDPRGTTEERMIKDAHRCTMNELASETANAGRVLVF